MATSLGIEVSVISPNIIPQSSTREALVRRGGSQTHSPTRRVNCPGIQMGKAKVLGIMQILLGILLIIIWIALILNPRLVAGADRTQLCGGLSVATCLALNMFSALLGVVNLVLFCIYIEIYRFHLVLVLYLLGMLELLVSIVLSIFVGKEFWNHSKTLVNKPSHEPTDQNNPAQTPIPKVQPTTV